MHNSISPASVGQFKSVYALLTVALGLLIAGSASATSMSYDIDAQFFSPFQSISGQGSFTADESGNITAFEWAAISSYGFEAFDIGDLYAGFATYDASGDLTGFTVSGITESEETTLLLGMGTGDGGTFAEMSNATGLLAFGTYTIRDAVTGTVVLGASASPMPEPSAAVLYGAGLLIANGTLRRRRQS